MWFLFLVKGAVQPLSLGVFLYLILYWCLFWPY